MRMEVADGEVRMVGGVGVLDVEGVGMRVYGKVRSDDDEDRGGDDDDRGGDDDDVRDGDDDVRGGGDRCERGGECQRCK